MTGAENKPQSLSFLSNGKYVGVVANKRGRKKGVSVSDHDLSAGWLIIEGCWILPFRRAEEKERKSKPPAGPAWRMHYENSSHHCVFAVQTSTSSRNSFESKLQFPRKMFPPRASHRDLSSCTQYSSRLPPDPMSLLARYGDWLKAHDSRVDVVLTSFHEPAAAGLAPTRDRLDSAGNGRRVGKWNS